ncbi:MAG: hypothetical protein ABIS47_12340 [Acidimicrobiales bacterium]
MPPITTTFACDPGLTRRSYRACHRKAFIIRWVTVVGIIGLGLASRLPFLALFGLFYALIAEVSVRRQLRSRHPGTTQVTVTMTDDGYRTDWATSSSPGRGPRSRRSAVSVTSGS